MIDLGVGVSRRQLHPDAHVVMGNERVRRHREVDAAIEQEVADLVHAIGVGERDLHDRQPGAVGRRDAELIEPREHASCQLEDALAQWFATLVVDPQALVGRRERRDR